jgi:hypothetical protein
MLKINPLPVEKIINISKGLATEGWGSKFSELGQYG